MRFLTTLLIVSFSYNALGSGLMTSNIDRACDLADRNYERLCLNQKQVGFETVFTGCADGFVYKTSKKDFSKWDNPKYGDHSTCKVKKENQLVSETTVYTSFGTKLVTKNDESNKITYIYGNQGFLKINNIKFKTGIKVVYSYTNYLDGKEKFLDPTFNSARVFDFVKDKYAVMTELNIYKIGMK